MKVAFHPGIMLINKEQIRFVDFFNWSARQIVYGRLYHPTWPILFGTGVATALTIGMSILVNATNLLTFHWESFWILTSTLVFYWGVWIAFVFQLDRTVAAMVCQPGEPRQWWSATTAIRIFFTAPLVQFIFLAGLFRASIMHRVSWRGIDYEISGPFDVRMIEYLPYGRRPGETVSDESIV